MSETNCGVVAVVGAPNAGKSTLVNILVGQKVAIVSSKVQTTRTRLMGIATEGDTQIVLIDTPGIFAPRRDFDRAMVRAAWESAEGADIILLLVDARRGITEEVERILEALGRRTEPKMLALTKVDIADKYRLLPLAEALNGKGDFAETFMISAPKEDGTEDLKATLAAAMPPAPWHFPADQVSDVTTRLLAAEVTREQLFRQLHEEVPYASAVETESFEEGDNGITIRQIIFIERDSQKAIVLGKKGARIKAIGSAARSELEDMLGTRVHLFLNVKVKPDWSEDREVLASIGMSGQGR